MKHLLLLILASLCIACSDDADNNRFDFLICDQIADNYKLYEDEEIGCHFHFMLAEYDGREYLELNSYCADLSRASIIDENCIDICDPLNNMTADCNAYLMGREVMDVVFIEK